MDLFLPYIICLLISLTIFSALRSTILSKRVMMIAAGVAGSGWLIGLITGSLASFGTNAEGIFFTIFSLSAIAAAIRMVTHHKPVYCALYFVLVVLATAGIFLLLEAEFMAFALIIVYAGAILITYMFVLMLSNQAHNSDQPETQAAYDQIPKDPAAAVGVGFFLLCLVTGTVIGGTKSMPQQGNPNHHWVIFEQLEKQFEATVMELDPTFSWPPQKDISGSAIQFGDKLQTDEAAFIVSAEDGTVLVLSEDVLPTNTQYVGWSLVADFPVNLELAGVILLMAMFGAAVLARRAIELGEQEKRAAILGDDVAPEGGDS